MSVSHKFRSSNQRHLVLAACSAAVRLRAAVLQPHVFRQPLASTAASPLWYASHTSVVSAEPLHSYAPLLFDTFEGPLLYLQVEAYAQHSAPSVTKPRLSVERKY